jgi:putative transposase
MGQTIQFESHKVELPFIKEYEFDDNVLEYYDQPGPIKISYRTVSGRQTTALTTPDYFVIRNDGSAGWEECKPEQDLMCLSKKSERFKLDGEIWRCPPGQEYAAQYGFYFRVRSSSEINWVWQRNIEYLSDYLQAPDHLVAANAESFLKALISCKQGIFLSELVEKAKSYTPDDIFQLIARDELYVDLHVHALSEQDRTPVYTSKDQATVSHLPIAALVSQPVTTEPGSKLVWDGRMFLIVNLGEGSIWLQGEQGHVATLTINKFDELIKTGAVRAVANNSGDGLDEISRQLKMKGPEVYARATEHYKAIVLHLAGTAGRPKTRTERHWISSYREAEIRYGYGYLGLLDNTDKKGNRLPKLPSKSYELMNTCVDEQYLNSTDTSPISVYGHYRNACEKADVIAASFKTFLARLKRLDAKDTEQSRKGFRAAYQLDEFYWELKPTIPRHGDRPFEIAHLDHTELDIQLVDSVTGGNLGRPWLTLMMDANSRHILAYVLSYEPPSYRSCMMVIRECVRIHNRLPQTLVVDGGAEFNSVYFEQLIAFYCITKKNRPGAQPRFGSVMERLFGVTNQQFVHLLRGNTQITKNVRLVTKAVNPANLAVWTLPKLKERIGLYFSKVYENLDHPSLGESSRRAFERGLAHHGVRPMKIVRYDDAFILSTLPSTSKGHAKVIQSRGIKINNFYYWHATMRITTGQEVAVRYDPYDIGTAYAFVKGQWVRCVSQFYAMLQGRSEKEITLITQEIMKRRSNHNGKIAINAQMVAAFIAETQGTELELKEMRQAAEMRVGENTHTIHTNDEDSYPLLQNKADDFELYDELAI